MNDAVAKRARAEAQALQGPQGITWKSFLSFEVDGGKACGALCDKMKRLVNTPEMIAISSQRSLPPMEIDPKVFEWMSTACEIRMREIIDSLVYIS